jgi:lysophospholipase L1-like esterase
VLIDRRTLLLGGLATVAAACTSNKNDAANRAADEAATPIRVAPGETVSIGQIEAKPTVPKEKVPKSVVMVGDSITALSKTTLETVLTNIGFESVVVNAEPSRRIEVGGKKPMPGLDVVKYIAASSPPEMWIIALGTNDAGLYATDEDYQGLIDDMLAAIPKDLPLVWMSVYRHDKLEGCSHFNILVRQALQKRGHATMGEWNQQCTNSEESILTNDGVHPNSNGILVFADTVRAAVASELN